MSELLVADTNAPTEHHMVGPSVVALVEGGCRRPGELLQCPARAALVTGHSREADEGAAPLRMVGQQPQAIERLLACGAFNPLEKLPGPRRSSRIAVLDHRNPSHVNASCNAASSRVRRAAKGSNPRNLGFPNQAADV